MLTERAGPNGLAARMVWADEHSICDIQLDQMLQFGWDLIGARVVHMDRGMGSGTRYWAPVPYRAPTLPHVTMLAVLGPNTNRPNTSPAICYTGYTD